MYEFKTENPREKDFFLISVVDFFNDNGTRGHVNQTLDFYDKERVVQEAIMLYNKYFVSEDENIIIGCDINANIKYQENFTFKDKINNLKPNYNSGGFKKTKENSIRRINTEINDFLRGNKKGKRLSSLYWHLRTMKETSISCERVFSLCRNSVTKNRTRLDVKKINMLLILKSWFFNK